MSRGAGGGHRVRRATCGRRHSNQRPAGRSCRGVDRAASTVNAANLHHLGGVSPPPAKRGESALGRIPIARRDHDPESSRPRSARSSSALARPADSCSVRPGSPGGHAPARERVSSVEISGSAVAARDERGLTPSRADARSANERPGRNDRAVPPPTPGRGAASRGPHHERRPCFSCGRTSRALDAAGVLGGRSAAHVERRPRAGKNLGSAAITRQCRVAIAATSPGFDPIPVTACHDLPHPPTAVAITGGARRRADSTTACGKFSQSLVRSARPGRLHPRDPSGRGSSRRPSRAVAHAHVDRGALEGVALDRGVARRGADDQLCARADQRRARARHRPRSLSGETQPAADDERRGRPMPSLLLKTCGAGRRRGRSAAPLGTTSPRLGSRDHAGGCGESAR